MVDVLRKLYNKNLPFPQKAFFWFLIALFIYLAPGYVEKMYWKWWPFKVLVVHSFKISSDSKIVSPGGMVKQDITFSKYINIQPTVYTDLINNVVITMAPVFPPEKKLGEDQMAHPVLELPTFAPAGTYVMRKTWVYPIGPNGRTEKVTAISDAFYVQEKASGCYQGPKGEPGEKGKQGKQGDTGKTGPGFWGDKK